MIECNETDTLNKAKKKCLVILASAKTCYEKAKAGKGNPLFMAGKALAYLAAFKGMAEALNLNADSYVPIIVNLERLIGTIITSNDVPSKSSGTTAILTPTGIKHVEDDTVVPVHERKDYGNHKLIVFSKIQEAMMKDGCSQYEARERALQVYKKDGTLDHLISEASAIDFKKA